MTTTHVEFKDLFAEHAKEIRNSPGAIFGLGTLFKRYAASLVAETSIATRDLLCEETYGGIILCEKLTRIMNKDFLNPVDCAHIFVSYIAFCDILLMKLRAGRDLRFAPMDFLFSLDMEKLVRHFRKVKGDYLGVEEVEEKIYNPPAEFFSDQEADEYHSLVDAYNEEKQRCFHDIDHFHRLMADYCRNFQYEKFVAPLKDDERYTHHINHLIPTENMCQKTHRLCEIMFECIKFKNTMQETKAAFGAVV